MTSSTSAVAVCRCSEFAQLAEQAGVLDRDHGLGGEALHQLDLLVGERPHLLPVDADDADQPALLEHRHEQERPRPAYVGDGDQRGIPVDIGLLGADVGNVLHLPGCGQPAERIGRAGSNDPLLPAQRDPFGQAVHQPDREGLAVIEQKISESRSADPHGIAKHCFEHRLERAGRARDDAEHLRGRGLLLQRLRQLAGAPLLGLEQPHVLDRDHRLVGEGLHQLDLLAGEGAHLRAPQNDDADRRPFAHERDTQPRSEAGDSLRIAEGVLPIGKRVRDMNRVPLQQDPPRQGAPPARYRGRGCKLDELPRHSIVGGKLKMRAVRTDDTSHVRLAQACGGLGQSIEHRLQVEGRAADHLEHVGGGGLLLEGLGQLAAALLLGLEQPHVLDRDHRLVGEGLHQLDLPVGERPHLGALQGERADRRTLTQQRRAEQGPIARQLLCLGLAVFRVGERVDDLHRPAFLNRPSDHRSASR